GEERDIAVSSAVLGKHLARGGDPAEALKFLVQAARSAWSQEEISRCRDLCTQVLDQFEKGVTRGKKAGTDRLEILLLRGQCNRMLWKAEEARDDYSQAVKLFQRDTEIGVKCRALSDLGVIKLTEGHREEAIKYLRKALNLARRADAAELLQECLSKMGNFHMRYGEGAKAKVMYEEAADHARQSGSRESNIRALMDLAYCRHALDHPRNSLDLMNQVAEMFPPSEHSTSAYGDIMYRLGGAQYFCSQYGKAYESLKQALRVFTQFGNIGSLAATLNLLGLSCSAMGLFHEAREHLEAALSLAREGGPPLLNSFILAHLGMARSYTDTDWGIDLIKEALQMAEAVEGDRFTHQYRHFLGLRLLALNQWDQAREQADRLSEIATRFKDRTAVTYAIHLKWMVSRDTGKRKAEILREIRRLERISQTVEPTKDRFELCWFLSDLHQSRSDMTKHRDLARQALTLWDEMGNELDRTKRRAHLNHPDRIQLLQRLYTHSAPLPDTAMAKTPGDEVEAFIQISHALNTLTDIEALLKRLLDIALKATGAARGLMLFQQEGRFKPIAQKNWSESEIQQELPRLDDAARAALQEASLLYSDPGEPAASGMLRDLASEIAPGTICLPLVSKGKALGVVLLDSEEPGDTARALSRQFLSGFANMAAAAFKYAQLFEEVSQDRERLRIEKDELRDFVKTTSSRFGIVGKSRAIQRVWNLIDKAAGANISVVITGETGTGKELVARAIHENSTRCKGPFISINSAALVETLLDSELFGVEKGTATDVEARIGKFELATGGTLFLDEISEMSPSCQAKLLRVLQEKKLTRIGGLREIPVDCRVIAASNRVLEDEVQAGRFRQDLLYRLGVFPVPIPSLRERQEDIPLLISFFIEHWAQDAGTVPPKISRTVMETLMQHPWPGNVRELENLIYRMLLLSGGKELRFEDLPPSFGGYSQPLMDQIAQLQLTEKELLSLYARKVLDAQGGSKKKALQILGIDFKTLQKRLK
ncbi:sigma 54-interacting transcriptional regulator, partial [Acidobacteriota bacterium]